MSVLQTMTRDAHAVSDTWRERRDLRPHLQQRATAGHDAAAHDRDAMILRQRSPDGANRDRDYGPGPVGKAVRKTPIIAAERVGHMVAPSFDGLYSLSPHGQRKRERKRPHPRLTPEQIQVIRARCDAGETQLAVSRSFDVDVSTVGKLMTRLRRAEA